MCLSEDELNADSVGMFRFEIGPFVLSQSYVLYFNFFVMVLGFIRGCSLDLQTRDVLMKSVQCVYQEYGCMLIPWVCLDVKSVY